MGRSYDLSSKSDMRRFTRDIEKDVQKQMSKAGIDVKCPGCKAAIKVTPGANVCPKCGANIDVDLTWSRK